jgi:hypothetical protein
MTAKDSPPTARSHRLDRQVVLTTAILWVAHLGVLTMRSAALVRYVDWSRQLANSVVAFTGFLLSLLVYAPTGSRRGTATRRFLACLGLSIPFCVLLAMFDEIVWLALADYWGLISSCSCGCSRHGARFVLLQRSVVSRCRGRAAAAI